MTTAFQSNAFQNNAFQIDTATQEQTQGAGGGTGKRRNQVVRITEDEVARARRALYPEKPEPKKPAKTKPRKGDDVAVLEEVRFPAVSLALQAKEIQLREFDPDVQAGIAGFRQGVKTRARQKQEDEWLLMLLHQ